MGWIRDKTGRPFTTCGCFECRYSFFWYMAIIWHHKSYRVIFYLAIIRAKYICNLWLMHFAIQDKYICYLGQKIAIWDKYIQIIFSPSENCQTWRMTPIQFQSIRHDDHWSVQEMQVHLKRESSGWGQLWHMMTQRAPARANNLLSIGDTKECKTRSPKIYVNLVQI